MATHWRHPWELTQPGAPIGERLCHSYNCKNKVERCYSEDLAAGGSVAADGHTAGVANSRSPFEVQALGQQISAALGSTCLVGDSSLSIDRIHQYFVG